MKIVPNKILYYDVRGVSPQQRRSKNLIGVPLGVPKHTPPNFEGCAPEDLPCPDTPESRQRTPSPRPSGGTSNYKVFQAPDRTRQQSAASPPPSNTFRSVASPPNATSTYRPTSPHPPTASNTVVATPSGTHRGTTTGSKYTVNARAVNSTSNPTPSTLRTNSGHSPRTPLPTSGSQSTKRNPTSTPPNPSGQSIVGSTGALHQNSGQGWNIAGYQNQSYEEVNYREGLGQAVPTPRTPPGPTVHRSPTQLDEANRSNRAERTERTEARGGADSSSIFAPGTYVEYKSRTMNDQWILAKVLDFDERTKTYKLDVQPRAQIDRVRLRETPVSMDMNQPAERGTSSNNAGAQPSSLVTQVESNGPPTMQYGSTATRSSDRDAKTTSGPFGAPPSGLSSCSELPDGNAKDQKTRLPNEHGFAASQLGNDSNSKYGAVETTLNLNRHSHSHAFERDRFTSETTSKYSSDQHGRNGINSVNSIRHSTGAGARAQARLREVVDPWASQETERATEESRIESLEKQVKRLFEENEDLRHSLAKERYRADMLQLQLNVKGGDP